MWLKIKIKSLIEVCFQTIRKGNENPINIAFFSGVSGWLFYFIGYTWKANSQERSDKGNLWKLCWYGIRKANIGIANLGNLVSATEEERNLIEGQLYFFRGWFHFMLMEWWGGMPYVDQVLPPDVAPALSRLTWQDKGIDCLRIDRCQSRNPLR